MNRALRPRKRQASEKEPVFRTPPELSDLVYEKFNTLAHTRKLTDGTAKAAYRMIREECFTREELLDIRKIINGEEETSELSAEILGGESTLDWIKAVLDGKVKPIKAASKPASAPETPEGSKAKAVMSGANG